MSYVLRVPDQIKFAEVVGRMLRRARESSGRSQGQIGDPIGKTAGSISEWESGKNLPESANMEAVLAQLGLTGAGAAFLMRDAATDLQRERAPVESGERGARVVAGRQLASDLSARGGARPKRPAAREKKREAPAEATKAARQAPTQPSAPRARRKKRPA